MRKIGRNARTKVIIVGAGCPPHVDIDPVTRRSILSRVSHCWYHLLNIPKSTGRGHQPLFDVVAVVDPSIENARALVGYFSVEQFMQAKIGTGPDNDVGIHPDLTPEVFALYPDAVVFNFAPPALQNAYTRLALENGRHVFAETLCTSGTSHDEIDTIAALAQRSNLVVQLCVPQARSLYTTSIARIIEGELRKNNPVASIAIHIRSRKRPAKERVRQVWGDLDRHVFTNMCCVAMLLRGVPKISEVAARHNIPPTHAPEDREKNVPKDQTPFQHSPQWERSRFKLKGMKSPTQLRREFFEYRGSFTIEIPVDDGQPRKEYGKRRLEMKGRIHQKQGLSTSMIVTIEFDNAARIVADYKVPSFIVYNSAGDIVETHTRGERAHRERFGSPLFNLIERIEQKRRGNDTDKGPFTNAVIFEIAKECITLMGSQNVFMKKFTTIAA